MGSPRVGACPGKDYLAGIKDPLWVRDILGTEFMLGYQSLHITVELHDAAIVLDPEDEAMCLQTRLGLGIAGNGRKFGLNQGFLQGHHQLFGFRVTKQNLGKRILAVIKLPVTKRATELVSATP